MSFKTISLPDKRPRDAVQLKKKLPLYKGLIPYYFFGVFALIGPFIPIVIIALNGEIGQIGWGPLVFAFFAAEIVAFILLNIANKNYLRRLKAFSNGVPIKGQLIEKTRAFIFWKSSKNYILIVNFSFKGKNQNFKISSSDALLHSTFGEKDEILGLYDPESDSVCFPPEIGLILEGNPANHLGDKRR
jgi:hypothetical protein